jgi:triosephosphate isomerase (TIM)
MRKKIAAGNWKMNKTLSEAQSLTSQILSASRPEGVKTILGVPYVYLSQIHELVHSSSDVDVAAQNCHQAASGAFTGEISVGMLKSIGVRYVIVGHSERREFFNETEDIILAKLQALHDAGITPIYCCGEPLSIRKEEEHKAYVINQMEGSLFQLTEAQMANTIIAYEPIWAIGTGETASPEQAQEMHQTIRESLETKFGKDLSDNVSILYGGSVKANNAKELFGQPDVDGGLVGGASLSADEFIQIINAF